MKCGTVMVLQGFWFITAVIHKQFEFETGHERQCLSHFKPDNLSVHNLISVLYY